jgi:hypothetical protein
MKKSLTESRPSFIETSSQIRAGKEAPPAGFRPSSNELIYSFRDLSLILS